MIEKVSIIKNLAVFKDFNWDKEVIDRNNKISNFAKINIIYGRNYSGKTTLSRIIRAMETDHISDKYGCPEFSIKFKNNNEDVNQNNLASHNKTIRVFNEDFIKENLKFINDENENIQSFAILGDNVNIENEIKELKDQLGSNIENEETNLYKDLKHCENTLECAEKDYSTAKQILEKQIKSKALDNSSGIRYQPDKFGDQNYTSKKLEDEIKIVLKDDFLPINDQQKQKAIAVLEEKTKDYVNQLLPITLNFNEISEQASYLITKKVGSSDKIEELVKNAQLNKWVQEGRKLHKGLRKVCAFCNTVINEDRWAALDKHFDEELEKLEKEISQLLSKIDAEKEMLKTAIVYKKEELYSEYHEEFEKLYDSYSICNKNYLLALEDLENQLKERKKDLLNEKIFEEKVDYSDKLISLRNQFDHLGKKSSNYTKELGENKKRSQTLLRLKEVYDFAKYIKYTEQIANINILEEHVEEARNNRDDISKEIKNLLNQINIKQKEQKDERKGATKVKELLSDFFGHQFLDLDAIEVEDEQTGNKNYVFEIQRDGKKAYHLSEGEQSLIAYCYFMAKLEDVDTKGKQPIIWIDDPISSLDSNHIFFLYSLIKDEIVDKGKFEQLFISTHNLDFLKYLKRLNGKCRDSTAKSGFKKYEKNYFIISRIDESSKLSLMPKYLREYITEFNYLFHQIFKCAQIKEITDENYATFYNFGNNARKFLEIYLFYKHPDFSEDIDKYKKFFGENNVPAILTTRITNEYSHLSGVLERGSVPIEVPEMNRVAKLIIKKLKENEEQYAALLRSIGIEEDLSETENA